MDKINSLEERDKERQYGITIFVTAFKGRLKDLRLNKKFSQKQLAEKLGIHVSTYANWEQGRTEPSIYDIFNLLLCLNIEANELFELSSFDSK